MKILTFAIFGVISLGMDVIYTLFSGTKGYKSLLIRGITVLSAFILAVASSNLNSVTSALSLFICMGFGVSILSEAMTISEIDAEKPKMITFGVLRAVSIALFGVSTLTLTGFNIFALGGGLLLGLGIGSVMCAIKKYKKGYQAFSTLAVWAAIGLLAGESIYGCINSAHFVSSLIILFAAVSFIVSQVVKSIAKEDAKIQYLANALYTFALTLMAVSIYFY
ncbi:MAG: hypothetical protein IJY90_02340 [Clostridia bacterium]|nr:hypothetical protein [Clostridia bacterium]